jgi:TRAP-type C4-dicarboxylate transport system permease small subunit
MLQQLSRALSRAEQWAAGFLALLITALIVFNVVTRALNQAVFWVDEMAIYAMVWMLFLAMAVLLKRRQAVAVTVLVDALPSGMRRVVGVFIDLCVLAFALLLLVFSWNWYAPLELARNGFDLDAFSAETMNFMYQERASTLPLKKFWVWLIVPYFGFSVALHTLANLLSDPRGHHMNSPGEVGS